MRMYVILPYKLESITETDKIIAEGLDGYFCILPKHIDFVSVLVPGILTFTAEDDREQFIAIDSGVLVKQGATVRISTFNAISGNDLGRLEDIVEYEFKQMDEREKKTRTLLYKMEIETMRSFIELGGSDYD